MKNCMNAFVELFNTYRDGLRRTSRFTQRLLCTRRSSMFSTNAILSGIDYEYHEQSKKEYYEEARKSHNALVESIDAACQAIRDRIAEVRVA